MEPWMIGLGMAVMLTVMLLTVVLAGRYVDRQHEDMCAEGPDNERLDASFRSGKLPPVVREAEEIVRSADARIRRDIDRREP
jgi:hypothetical protein